MEYHQSRQKTVVTIHGHLFQCSNQISQSLTTNLSPYLPGPSTSITTQCHEANMPSTSNANTQSSPGASGSSVVSHYAYSLKD